MTKLIATCYNKSGKGKLFIKTKQNEIKTFLENSGDFRGTEVQKYKNECDIIVTNPPFSLLIHFFEWIKEKKYIFLSSIQSIKYKAIFPYFKANIAFCNGKVKFFINENKEIVEVTDCLWINNFFTLNDGFLHCETMDWNLKNSQYEKIKKNGYPKFDNYNAIECSFIKSIPSDYDGVIGVPITFLREYNPKQFKLVDCVTGIFICKKEIFTRIMIQWRKDDC